MNLIWDHLRDSIIKAAKDHILHHKVANNSQQRLLKHLIQLQSDIKQVNYIYY